MTIPSHIILINRLNRCANFSGMFLLLVHVLLVSSSLQKSLSSLVVSARLSRGYAYEPRHIVGKKTNSLVDGIPHVTTAVQTAIKATMLSSYDIADVMKRLRKFSAIFRAFQLQSKQLTSSSRKKLRDLVTLLPKVVLTNVAHVIDSHKKLPNWDHQIDATVTSMVGDLPDRLTAICSTTDSLSKAVTFTMTCHASIFGCEDVIHDIFTHLADRLRDFMETTYSTRPLPELLSLSAYMLDAGAEAFRFSFVIWRVHHKLLIKSLFAVNKPSWRVKGDRLTKTFILEQTAAVTKTYVVNYFLPFGDLDLETLPGEHNTAVLIRIAELKKQYAEASLQVAKPEKEISALAKRIIFDKGTAADYARLSEIDALTPHRKKEITFLELRHFNFEYVCRAPSQYKNL